MPKIELTWRQTMQYRTTFGDETKWAAFVRSLNADLDPTDLDAVYDYLNTGQGLAEEYLNDMANNETWIGTVDVEVDDLVRDGEFVEDAAADANG